MPSLKWTFVISLLVGACAVLVLAAVKRPPATAASATAVVAKELAGGVWIAEQVTPQQLRQLKARGFRAIVDLRPDGEAPGQPSASEMSIAAKNNGLHFSYLPVPHGDIPPPAVDTLQQTLATTARPVLLYCRSGRRAARTWALAEASRVGGLDATAIGVAVDSAGQASDDLAAQIAARVSRRTAMP